MDCVFCGIAARRIPAMVISETEKSMAFMDAFPLAGGHSLVIPKRHHERIQDMSPDENADLFETARRLIARVDGISGATLMAVHNGRGSGQEIPHVHVHLIPRREGDGAGPVHSMFGKPARAGDAELAKSYGKLKGL